MVAQTSAFQNQPTIGGGIGTSGKQPIGNLLLKRPYIPKGLSNVQQVMASPPTVAISTTNPNAAGQFFSATNNSGFPAGQFLDLSAFGISAAGNPVVSGLTTPDPVYVSWQTVSAGTGANIGGYNGANMVKIRVDFSSPAALPALVLQCKGLTGQLFIKINDQYTSLTPTTIPNNGAANFVSITWAAPITNALTIEFICDDVLNQFRFGGMWTLTGDTLMPAQIRGPRVIVMGDSFTTATGAGGMALGFVNVFSEYMGWDDVWPSGIGGTGLINPGTAVNYVGRVQNDVIAFAPDEVIIQGFFNDGSSTGGAVQAQLTLLINMIQAALPATRITVVGPYIVNGSGYQPGTSSPNSVGIVSQRTALPAAVAQASSSLVRYLDPSSFGPTGATPLTAILSAHVNAGATAFTIQSTTNISAGKTVQWPDGSRSFIISVAGLTATVDNIPNAQNAGAVITECPGCYLRGNGHVGGATGVGNADFLVFTDAIHPSATGHIVLGTAFAQYYANFLNS